MSHNSELGKWGEQVAQKYLKSNGYTIVHRDWRSGHRDIDIVALYDDTLVFVEVKTRSTSDLASPEITIPPSKRRNLAAAINHYIKSNYVEYDFRFDIITVIGSVGYEPKIEHLIDVNLF